MKDQVVMNPVTGDIGVAIPLFRLDECEDLTGIHGYSVAIIRLKPLFYAIDAGDEVIFPIRADVVERNLEFLGEL